jgi:hypothetical protein
MTEEQIHSPAIQAGNASGGYHVRITPRHISSLYQNQVFVFGSNLDGLHIGGAAAFAQRNFGALKGIREGLAGNSYALPTMITTGVRLSIKEIEGHVQKLHTCVLNNPDIFFLITPIGTGIAGYTAAHLAHLFKDFLDIKNCSLPLEFIQDLTDNFSK